MKPYVLSTREPKEEVSWKKSIWDNLEKVAKTLSLIAIPIVIAVLGWLVQERLEEKM